MLFIYCCGGLGREVLLLARQINNVEKRWNEICFVDDNCDDDEVNGAKVYTLQEVGQKYDTSKCEFIIASGEPFIRELLHNKLIENKLKITTLIHPNVEVPKDCKIEEGCVINSGAIMTANVHLEKGCCIYNNVTLHHDVHIKPFAFISGNSILCGNVNVGKRTYIGCMVAIRDELSIGKDSVIGMGSIVVSNIEDSSIAYGNPAKVKGKNIKKRVFN